MATEKTVFTSVKIILISTGVITLAILLSVTLPHLITVIMSEIPMMLTTVKSWLRPPYLYFIINGIIITIVASSRLHRFHHHAPSQESEVHVSLLPPQNVVPIHHHDVMSGQDEVAHEEVTEVMVMDSLVEKAVEDEVAHEEVKEVMAMDSLVEKAVEDEVAEVVETFGWGSPPLAPLRRQEPVAGFLSKRPAAVSRFGHMRPTKGSPTEGGNALRRVAEPKPKKNDTLESTWRAITEGRHIPLTRHLEKSDTRETNNNDDNQIDLLDSSPIPEVKKSQTFMDRTNFTSRPLPLSATKLKKEPSLSQDELNRRAEEFINKFNEDMRLQKQQSMQQFMEMINRAT